MMLTPNELRERLFASGLAHEESLRGCTDKDIREIENILDHPLPPPYVQFLKTAGREAGDFMSDLSVFYPEVLSNTDSMRNHIREFGGELPPNAFVICDRFGEQLLYFLVGKSNDPPIFRWCNEEPTKFTRVCDCFWDWIEEELNGHEYMLQ